MDPSGRHEEEAAAREVLHVSALRPSKAAEHELRWFFGPAASEIEPPSNYEPMIEHRRRCRPAESLVDYGAERRAAALHAAGIINGRLARLRPADVWTLEELFSEQDEGEARQAQGSAQAAVAAYEAVRGSRPSVAPDDEQEEG